MKKIMLVVVIVAASFAASAQSGKNQLGIGVELGLSTTSGGGTFVGGTAKYMHGVGTAGQVTLTSGYLSHSETVNGVTISASEIPVLLGYRHYFSGLFIEPQAGYISDHAKVSGSGSTYSASHGSFGYAIGGGYAMPSGLDLGVSFRNTAESGSVGMIVFRVGYNFSLSGSSSK